MLRMLLSRIKSKSRLLEIHMSLVMIFSTITTVSLLVPTIYQNSTTKTFNKTRQCIKENKSNIDKLVFGPFKGDEDSAKRFSEILKSRANIVCCRSILTKDSRYTTSCSKDVMERIGIEHTDAREFVFRSSSKGYIPFVLFLLGNLFLVSLRVSIMDLPESLFKEKKSDKKSRHQIAIRKA